MFCMIERGVYVDYDPDPCVNIELLIHSDPCVNLELLMHPDPCTYLDLLIHGRTLSY